MKFIDEAAVTVAAGNGGDGIVAWRREKYVDMGGPAGGDGGHGGTVYLEASAELSTLIEFRFKRAFAADSGKAGGTSNKSGKAGEDLVIAVPVGTIVYRTLEGQTEAFLADLKSAGDRLEIAKGGRGGLGNQHFATSTRQAPRFAEKGEPGEKCSLRLELRLLADCGVIGLPNAGKSTLLSVVSAARPKIADYPFTTLEPQLGVVRVADDESFVMVDVPGLIEGAHEGAGLGDQFLRHVERTRVLIHLLDGAKSLDEMLADKTTIEHELQAWDPKLIEKPTMLVVSKLDLPDAQDRLNELRIQFPDLVGVSSATNLGIKELVYSVWQTIAATPLPEIIVPEAPRIVLAPNEPFHIEKQGSTYIISGERVERLAAMTDFDIDEGLGRFE
ncbi:MAG: GTPase ObgE, partial [Candidatus Baltobacteraceae bacterium]